MVNSPKPPQKEGNAFLSKSAILKELDNVKKFYVLVTFEENKVTLDHPTIIQPLLNEFAYIRCFGRNAYKIDLPEEYEFLDTFNVSNPLPYHGEPNNEDSRMSLLQPGELGIGVHEVEKNYLKNGHTDTRT